jgi:DNA mismatch endonuclease (patch repair protein)
MGYRFRLHKKELPGKPDITLSKFKNVIFVHGCFWHRHKNCREASRPKTNSQYWENKINNNIIRDKKHEKELNNLGWNVIIIWECELKGSLEEMIEIIRRKIS